MSRLSLQELVARNDLRVAQVLERLGEVDGSFTWLPASPVALMDDVDYEAEPPKHVEALADMLRAYAKDDASPVQPWTLFLAAAHAVRLPGEGLRIAARGAALGELNIPNVFEGEDEGANFQRVFMGLSGVAGIAKPGANGEPDAQSEDGYVLKHLFEAMKHIQSVQVINQQGQVRVCNPHDGDDFQFLVEHANFNPFPTMIEMMGHFAKPDTMLVGWYPVKLEREEWASEEFYGAYSERTFAVHAAHEQAGHVGLFFAVALDELGRPNVRLVKAVQESVEEHASGDSRLPADPFGKRVSASGRKHSYVEVDGEQGAYGDEERLRQAARMHKALSEMLEQQAKRISDAKGVGEGWQSFEEEGGKQVSDPFDGLILSGGRKVAKA